MTELGHELCIKKKKETTVTNKSHCSKMSVILHFDCILHWSDFKIVTFQFTFSQLSPCIRDVLKIEQKGVASFTREGTRR